MRTSIGATTVSKMSATAQSSPAFSQAQRREMISALLLSPTPPADSIEQKAAWSNTAAKTIA